MRKLSCKPYSLGFEANRHHRRPIGVPVLVPRPAEPRTKFVEDEKPRRYYRGSVRASLNNTCEVCGELVQEPGDLYCNGGTCPEERDNGCLLDDLRGEDDE